MPPTRCRHATPPTWHRRHADGPSWIAPGPNGAVPDSHPVKVKVSSGIFHVPGGRFYERTSAERCYPNAEAAEADGYRPSKS